MELLCIIIVLTWKGKTIHLEDLVVKEKCTVEPVMLCIQKLSNKVKDQVRRVEWNVLDWNTRQLIL
jgi:hypothetical protein